jgi:hypothetical protein
MLQSKAWQRRVDTMWLDRLRQRQIRRVESMQPALLPDGRRLRGVLLAPGLCLARNRRFYEIAQGKAYELPTSVVLAQYSVAALQKLFRSAAERYRATQADRKVVALTRANDTL